MVKDSRDPKDLHPKLQEVWAYASAEYAKRHPASPKVFITCTTRSKESQLKAKMSGASRAAFGQSPHNYAPAYAFDVAFLDKNGKLDWNTRLFKMFTDIIKERYNASVDCGIDWRFYDAPHIELRGWKNLVKK